MSVLMGLGAFRFSMSAPNYQSLSREATGRWPAQPRVGRAPALQFTGEGEETLSLAGTLYPHYTGGLDQIEAMRVQCKTGTPLMLVSGLGFVFGLWSILSVSDEQSFFMAGGLPRKVTFTIELSAYGPDGSGIIGGLF